MPDQMDLTQHWEEFYPSDWLVNGGAPLTGCPDAEPAIEVGIPLTIMLLDNGSWIITAPEAQGVEGEKIIERVLFRSVDFQDILNYLKRYRNDLERWVEEGDQ